MTIKKDKPQKLYYSISEVAQMFDINESALRFWEKEFDMINPRKNEKGTRFYKEEDIYYLLKEQGMTLAGAKKKLRDNKEKVIRQVEVVNKLKLIRAELLSIKEAFDRIDPED